VPTDRILALIDILADTEGRMKWAANKRLHLEIGLIKAIQSLNDARISDVIKALAGAGPIEQPSPQRVQETPAAQTTREPAKEPAPKETPPWNTEKPEKSKATPTPAPPIAAATQPVATPEPPANQPSEPKPETPEKKMGFDDFIDAASDEPAAVIPTPGAGTGPLLTPEPPKEAEKAEPKADDFYKDPLIKSALEIFEGTLK